MKNVRLRCQVGGGEKGTYPLPLFVAPSTSQTSFHLFFYTHHDYTQDAVTPKAVIFSVNSPLYPTRSRVPPISLSLFLPHPYATRDVSGYLLASIVPNIQPLPLRRNDLTDA